MNSSSSLAMADTPLAFCVVCGAQRDDLRLRNSGLKCPECVGKRANKMWSRQQKAQVEQFFLHHRPSFSTGLTSGDLSVTLSTSGTTGAVGSLGPDDGSGHVSRTTGGGSGVSSSAAFYTTHQRRTRASAARTDSAEAPSLHESDASAVIPLYNALGTEDSSPPHTATEEDLTENTTTVNTPSGVLEGMSSRVVSCKAAVRPGETSVWPDGLDPATESSLHPLVEMAMPFLRTPSRRATPYEEHPRDCPSAPLNGPTAASGGGRRIPPHPPSRTANRDAHHRNVHTESRSGPGAEHPPQGLSEVDRVGAHPAQSTSVWYCDPNSAGGAGEESGTPRDPPDGTHNHQLTTEDVRSGGPLTSHECESSWLAGHATDVDSFAYHVPEAPRDGDAGACPSGASSVGSHHGMSTTSRRELGRGVAGAASSAPAGARAAVSGPTGRRTTVTFHCSREGPTAVLPSSSSPKSRAPTTSTAQLDPQEAPSTQRNGTATSSVAEGSTTPMCQARGKAPHAHRQRGCNHLASTLEFSNGSSSRQGGGSASTTVQSSHHPMEENALQGTNSASPLSGSFLNRVDESAEEKDDDTGTDSCSLDNLLSHSESTATVTIDDLRVIVSRKMNGGKRSSLSVSFPVPQDDGVAASNHEGPGDASSILSRDVVVLIKVVMRSGCTEFPLVVLDCHLLSEVQPVLKAVALLGATSLPPLPSMNLTSLDTDVVLAEVELFINAVMRNPFFVRHPAFVQLLQLEWLLRPPVVAPAPAATPSPATLTQATLNALRHGSTSSSSHRVLQRTDSMLSIQSTRTSAMRRRRLDAITNGDLGHAQLGNVLGRGSFGTVYLGLVNTQCGSLMVAVKVVHVVDEENLRALQEEEEVLRRAKHRGIIQGIGSHYFPEKQELHIYTEYIECGTIHSMVKRFGSMPLLTIQSYMIQILRAIAYLHSVGIVHGDIKGENILVTKNGRVKVTDFGCWNAMNTASSTNRNDEGSGHSTGSTPNSLLPVGTPLWMSPEVINGAAPDAAADIWAVGCVGIEMLDRPLWRFEGQNLNPFVLLYRVGSSGTPPHGLPTRAEVAERFPQAVAAPEREGFLCYVDFLEKCFVLDPTERWGAAQLLEHLFIRTPLGRNLRWEV